MRLSKRTWSIFCGLLLLFSLSLLLGISQINFAQSSGVTWETIEKAAYAAVDQPFEKVVQDESSWNNFWNELHSGKPPTEPLPTVDFSENMVIGVGIGNKSSGGYSVEIQEITIEDSMLLVNYVEEQPGANCFTTQALTQPYLLVKVQQSNLPVKFKRQTEVNNC